MTLNLRLVAWLVIGNNDKQRLEPTVESRVKTLGLKSSDVKNGGEAGPLQASMSPGKMSSISSEDIDMATGNYFQTPMGSGCSTVVELTSWE